MIHLDQNTETAPFISEQQREAVAGLVILEGFNMIIHGGLGIHYQCNNSKINSTKYITIH